MEIVMPILKSLTFTAVPTRGNDPVANRRAKLVERLEEQKALIADPSYVRKTQRWTGKGDDRRQVEKQQRVRPWWRADATGALVLSVFHGTRPIEFEKGKGGIAVASRDKLPALFDSLIGAVRAGELDELLTRLKPVGTPKARRAA
jgi:plasmid stabilization system protein ParE